MENYVAIFLNVLVILAMNMNWKEEKRKALKNLKRSHYEKDLKVLKILKQVEEQSAKP